MAKANGVLTLTLTYIDKHDRDSTGLNEHTRIENHLVSYLILQELDLMKLLLFHSIYLRPD